MIQLVDFRARFNGYSVDTASQISEIDQLSHQIRTPVNKLGYIPLVGTVVASCRILINIVKLATLAFLFLAKNDDKIQWDKAFKNSFSQIGRGIVELFPVVGGGLTYLMDSREITFQLAEYNHILSERAPQDDIYSPF